MPEEIKEKKEGLVVEEVKDDMPEASFEGEFYKPSQYSVKGIDRELTGDIAGQIPVFATAQTYTDAAVNFAFDLKEKGFEGAAKDAVEFIQEDAAGPGLGNRLTRWISAGTGRNIQNLANIEKRLSGAKLGDGDARIFFGEPVPDFPLHGLVDEFGATGVQFAEFLFLLKHAGNIIPKYTGFKGKQWIGNKIAESVPARTRTILDNFQKKLRTAEGAFGKSKVDINLGKGNKIEIPTNPRVPRGIPNPLKKNTPIKLPKELGGKRVQDLLFRGTKKSLDLTSELALEGYLFDQLDVRSTMVTGEYDENGVWQPYSGWPAWTDLYKNSPDTTFAEAGEKQGIAGIFLGSGFAHLFEGARVLRAYKNFGPVFDRKYKAQTNLRAKKRLTNGEAEITPEVVDEAFNKGNEKELRRIRVAKILPEVVFKQPELIETPELKLRLEEVYEAEKTVRNDPAKTDSIINAEPSDAEFGQKMGELIEAGDDLRKAKELAEISTPETAGKYRMEQIDNIDVQPQVMQFKAAGVLNKSGVSGELIRKAPEFDQKLAGPIQVWRNPETNRLTVVNGHNRLWLAKKSGRLDIAVEEISARDAADARTQGAMRNIAEGHGESVDIAKLMRDANITPEDLATKYNLDVGTAKTATGIELSRLPSELFTKVIDGEIVPDRGAALGSIEGLDDSIIREVAKEGKNWSAPKLREAMKIAANAIVTTGEEGFLKDLGMSVKNSDFKKRAAVNQYAKNVLKNEIRALRAVAKGGKSQEIIEAAGNIVNVEGSRGALDEAAILSQRFNEVALNAGPVKTILDEIVEGMQGAGDAAARRAVDKRLAELKEAINQEVYKPQIEDPWKPVDVEAPRKVERGRRASAEIRKQAEEIEAKVEVENPITTRPYENLDKEELNALLTAKKKDLLSERQVANRTAKIETLEAIDPAQRTTKQKRDLARAKRELAKDLDAKAVTEEMDSRVIDQEPPVAEPLKTAIEKVPQRTPISKFLRMAPEQDQAEIALNRLVEAMNKFSDGAKGNAGAIDTVGDLINLLNIARVATEEAVQKALRDYERVVIYLQQPMTKLFPWTKALLDENRTARAAKLVDEAGFQDLRIQALGPEPAHPDSLIGGRGKLDTEAKRRWDAQKIKHEDYWNKRTAIEEELGLIEPNETKIEKAAEDNPGGSLSGDIPKYLRQQDLGNGRTNKFKGGPEERQDFADYVKLKKTLDRVAGKKVKLKIEPELRGTYSEGQAAAYGMEAGTQFEGLGMYGPKELTDEIDDIVFIAAHLRGKKLNFRTKEFTVLHESFHRLQWRYLTPGELNTLVEFDDEIRALAADVVQSMGLSQEFARSLLDGTISSNEAQAIAFSGWGEFGHLYTKTEWSKPFKKLAEIIKNAQRWLFENKSYTTFDEIFEQAYKGDIAQRKPLSGYDSNLAQKMVKKQRRDPDIMPNGPLMVADNNSKVPFEGDESFARVFAEILEQNKGKIARGETTPEELWSENMFQKTQSQSGKYVYNHQSENLLEGLDAMGRANMGATRSSMTGAPTFDGIQVQKDSHKWFEERGANGAEILGGLESLTEGFTNHEVGALYRAMDFADKLQLRAQIEAEIWRSAATNPKVDQRVQLARLVRSADSARRMHLAIMNITRRWGQLGQEMQLPRDIDTYQIPDDYKLPTRGESVVRQALEKELVPTEGMADLATKFKGLKEALEIGQVDLDTKVAADEIADSVLIASANPRGATGTWSKFDGEISKAENPIKGMQLARSANLINGGLTTSKAIVNGVFNMGLLAIEQGVGGAISRDYGRSLYAAQMFGSYLNNLQAAFRNAAIAFKTGRPLGNLDRSSLDVLGKIADEDAQGELFANKTDRTGWTINTMDMEKQWAETEVGKIQNALWQVLGSSGARLAVTIDSFNSTVAGWSYEFFRHMPRGMELAVEAGHRKFSKEAFDEAFKYAEKRVDSAVRSAVIDGKNMTEVAIDSPHAKYFQDSVNFTEDILPAMEARTMGDGFERGRAKGLEGEELTQYATDWVKQGDFVQRVANGMTNDWAVNPGRWGSIPGILLTKSADFPVVGFGIRFIQPFMRVPTNIFKASLRRGFVPGTPIPTSIFVDSWWRDVASSDPGTRQRAIGQVAVAAGAAQLLALATNMGLVRINGSGPEDYNARQKWLADRQMTHSLQVWDDDINYWSAPVSLAAFEPYATVFGYIGDYNDTQARMTDDERNKSAAALTFELMQLQLSGIIKKTYFSGINDFYEAALDKNKVLYGSTNRISRFTGWLQRTLASTVPLNAPVKHMRMQLDPTRRRIEPDLAGGVGGYFNEQFAAVKQNIPGYSKENPAILDWSAPGAPPVEAPNLFFTKDMAENYPWAASFMQYVPVIGAFPVGKQVTDPVKQEMYSLHGKGTSFLGPTASDFGRPDLYLTPTELNKYKEIFANYKDVNGLTWHQRTTQLINGSFYRSLPDETPSSKFASKKAAAIQMLITEYKGYAKKVFEETVPKGIQIKEAREELERRNLETEVMMQNRGNASQFNQKVNY